MIPLKSFQINIEKSHLFFEQGIVGYSDHKIFDFFSLADKGLSPLKMIVSMDPIPLSFIVIDAKDIGKKLLTFQEEEIFQKDIPFLPSDYDILYIAIFQKFQNEIQLTVNIRAPLIIINHESSSFQAWQYILPFSHLNTRFPLPHIAENLKKQLNNKN